jgi:hypothetical protein
MRRHSLVLKRRTIEKGDNKKGDNRTGDNGGLIIALGQ